MISGTARRPSLPEKAIATNDGVGFGACSHNASLFLPESRAMRVRSNRLEIVIY